MEENTEQRIDLTLFFREDTRTERTDCLRHSRAGANCGLGADGYSGKRTCADRRCSGRSEDVIGSSHCPVD